jgi:hypothetical protein
MAALVVANLALVPPLGLLGASFAALLAMTVWSGALWFAAWMITGVDVSLRARLVAPKVMLKAAD